MSSEMTSRERLVAVFNHRMPDRVPMMDNPWEATVERWRREGLPADVSVADYFGFDRTFSIRPDNSPRFPRHVIEETGEYTVATTAWGVTQKNWKHHGGVPEFLDHRIKDRESWADARARMAPAEDRVDWTRLEREYPKARQRGDLIFAGGWFGFDVTHSWVCGTERILMALVEDPDWCREMFMHELDVQLALFDMIRARGYEFDVLYWPDDLGYRNGPLFSPAMYRSIVQPVHAKACAWAHAKGMKTLLHSCGNVMALVPDLLNAGVDGLNPLEQKAGMDALGLKRDVGDRLVLMGGVDVRRWAEGGEDLEQETVSKIEALKADGGYIFHSDHSVPENVGFKDYCRVIELAREHGRYD
ncbi:MAG: hypothetical protein BIFFINMI_03379 [Phycisphaerae bacterium]|nr:hypothetical protein [Phycisphaerae bacterium]